MHIPIIMPISSAEVTPIHLTITIMPLVWSEAGVELLNVPTQFPVTKCCSLSLLLAAVSKEIRKRVHIQWEVSGTHSGVLH